MMPCLFQPLWLLLASTADSKLAPVVKYLKAENRILRAKIPGPVPVTPRERERLVKLGSALGAALAAVIGIVSYRTFRRWVVGTGSVALKAPNRKPGRSRTDEEIRELILKLARENRWGYTRVLGELKKLGITTVSRTTVANILRAARLDPGPTRGEGAGVSSCGCTRRRRGRATSCRRGPTRWAAWSTCICCSSSTSGAAR